MANRFKFKKLIANLDNAENTSFKYELAVHILDTSGRGDSDRIDVQNNRMRKCIMSQGTSQNKHIHEGNAVDTNFDDFKVHCDLVSGFLQNGAESMVADRVTENEETMLIKIEDNISNQGTESVYIKIRDADFPPPKRANEAYTLSCNQCTGEAQIHSLEMELCQGTREIVGPDDYKPTLPDCYKLSVKIDDQPRVHSLVPSKHSDYLVLAVYKDKIASAGSDHVYVDFDSHSIHDKGLPIFIVEDYELGDKIDSKCKQAIIDVYSR